MFLLEMILILLPSSLITWQVQSYILVPVCLMLYGSNRSKVSFSFCSHVEKSVIFANDSDDDDDS
jgi:hypothetical protein